MNDRSYSKRLEKYYSRTNEKKIVTKLLNDLFENKRFSHTLDIGAGKGDITGPLYDKSEKLNIIEQLPEHKEELLEKFPEAEIIIDSINATQLTEKYDLILYSQALYYQDDWESLCKKLLASLDVGGKLIIIMNSDSGDWWKIVSTHLDLKTFNYIPLSKFKNKLELFSKVTSIPYSSKTTFENLEDIVELAPILCLALSDSKIIDDHLSSFELIVHEIVKVNGGVVLNVDAEILVIEN